MQQHRSLVLYPARLSWSISTQIAVLGVAYATSCSEAYSMVGLGASVTVKARSTAVRAIGRISGAVLLLLAALFVCME
ncbi:hypothetical protein DENIT_140041 [Pseudomonas veronii]|uniref:Uncharacterized protein n=1 Tax=Ectopseudomonas oleovorans TaxID=301 RepID=A0A653BBJ5_ECTOL|nr:hypothetical protein DENIT_140041 [Pseudomonas veronii]CAE6924077.1 conserved protein of unknown function [Pseudomonas oleovorans]